MSYLVPLIDRLRLLRMSAQHQFDIDTLDDAIRLIEGFEKVASREEQAEILFMSEVSEP